MYTLFEISWEVCNKVGGIYTVIESKAPYIREKVKDYFFIGPFFPGQKNLDFEEESPPERFKEVFRILESKKIRCHFGKWVSTGVETILVDFSEFSQEKDEIKEELWNNYKVDSLKSDYGFEEPIIWSKAVGVFLEEIAKLWNKEIIAHCHEWLSGNTILHLKKVNAKVASVFTTHATVLERTMAHVNEYFHENQNSDEESYKRGVNDKHQIEKASALNASIFTSVSEVTAESARKILGRKAEHVLINGVDLRDFPNMEQVPEVHKKSKEKIRDFLMSNFFPYYYFDLDDTLFYYLAGRYEIHAKGIDVFIKALGKLNDRLKKENSPKNIVAFLFIPTAVEDENHKIVESEIILKNIKERIRDYSKELNKNILNSVISKNKSMKILNQNFLQEMKKMVKIFGKKGNPHILTHVLSDPQNDQILRLISQEGLDNKKDDPVKLIYYPAYLDLNDGLLNMNYYETIAGCHLGVFPSFYEPWGYTPVESAAYGVPSITTDMSGFGKFVESELKSQSKDGKGIIVIKRKDIDDEKFTEELTRYMYWYLHLPKHKRINNKIIAESFVPRLNWSKLVENYLNSYNDAIKKTYKKE